jgi:cell division septum initiation protein DivIVA
MSEIKETQDINQETPAPDQANQQGPEINVEELVSKAIEDVKLQLKSEISGLNRRNSELEKELKKKDLEKLSEKERIQAELDEAREEKKRIEQEAAEIIRGRNVDKELYDAGLSVEFAKRVIGQTEEEIKADVKALKKFIDAEINKGIEAEVNRRLSGKPPQAGGPVEKGNLQTLFDDAKKRNRMEEMIAVKRQAARQGIIIQE